MTRVLLPRMGKGRKVLGGVVFTDGAAEASFGPSIRSLFEARGAALIDGAEQLDEHTIDELRDIADRGGIHLGSHLHKADIVRVLLGGSPVDHEAEAKGSDITDVEPPAGDATDDHEDDDEPVSPDPAAETPATAEVAPTEIAPETSAHDPEEGTTWQPSPPSTTSPTTTGSLSLQDRRRQLSQDS